MRLREGLGQLGYPRDWRSLLKSARVAAYVARLLLGGWTRRDTRRTECSAWAMDVQTGGLAVSGDPWSSGRHVLIRHSRDELLPLVASERLPGLLAQEGRQGSGFQVGDIP
jgi:hypothetical protein